MNHLKLTKSMFFQSIMIIMILSMVFTEQQYQLHIHHSNQSQVTIDQSSLNVKHLLNIPRLRQRINEIWHNHSRIIEWKNNLAKLRRCYHSEYNGEHLNIFHLNINVIIEKFFNGSNLLANITIDKIIRRILLFVRNMVRLIHLIRECLRGRFSSKLGITSLSAYSQQEMYALGNSKHLQMTDGHSKNRYIPFSHCYLDDRKQFIPREFDWRDHGVVTDIKNQENCGSCYAFASTATVESLLLRSKLGFYGNYGYRQHYDEHYGKNYKKHHGKRHKHHHHLKQRHKRHHHHKHYQEEMQNLSSANYNYDYNSYNYDYKQQSVDLSEQHIVNCVGHCNGSNVIELFDFIRNHGIVYETNEPYRNKATSCRNDYKERIRIKDFCFEFKRVHSDREIQSAILRYGPIFGAASFNKNFQFLRGPYYGECRNSRKYLHHSIVLIGWTAKHWIIKNSWGNNWGIDGYLYLSRQQPNHCGIGWILVAPIGISIDKIDDFYK